MKVKHVTLSWLSDMLGDPDSTDVVVRVDHGNFLPRHCRIVAVESVVPATGDSFHRIVVEEIPS